METLVIDAATTVRFYIRYRSHAVREGAYPVTSEEGSSFIAELPEFAKRIFGAVEGFRYAILATPFVRQSRRCLARRAPREAEAARAVLKAPDLSALLVDLPRVNGQIAARAGAVGAFFQGPLI